VKTFLRVKLFSPGKPFKLCQIWNKVTKFLQFFYVKRRSIKDVRSWGRFVLCGLCFFADKEGKVNFSLFCAEVFDGRFLTLEIKSVIFGKVNKYSGKFLPTSSPFGSYGCAVTSKKI